LNKNLKKSLICVMRLPPVLATIHSGSLDSGRMAMKRALLVEDHAAFREALAKVLEWEAGFEKVPQAGSLSEGLARACWTATSTWPS
jgi:hypothetical protein